MYRLEVLQEKTAQASATRVAMVIEAQRQDLVQAQVPQGDAAAYRSTKNDQASNVELVPWAQEKKKTMCSTYSEEKKLTFVASKRLKSQVTSL